jgi:PAS domain S-box-containing protein
MKLRSKTLIFSGVIIVILILILLAISQFVFLTTYSDFENRYSYHVLKDELTQFNFTISAMNQSAKDWAQWDDAYSFVSGNNPSFVTNNLPSNIFNRLHLNVIIFVDNSGKIVYGKAYDLENNKYVNLPQNLSKFTNTSPILQHNNFNGISGVINLPEGPMIIVSKPIVTSHEQGPIKGTLIMGRFITPSELKTFINIPNSTLAVESYNTTSMSSDYLAILPSLSNSTPWTEKVLGPNSIASYALVNDIYGNPGIVLRSEMARTLYKSYLDSLLYFIGSIALVGIMFVIIILYSLDKNVLNRLDKIITEILDIGKKGDLKRRVTVNGNDELSDLASSINSSLFALQKSEKDLENSEKKYRNIFENTGTAMIIAEEDMTISLVNRTFANILGQKHDQIEGNLNWIEMIVSEDREIVKKYHKSELNKDKSDHIVPKNYEVRIMINNELRDFFATFDFIPGTKKSLISLIDITDRKKAESLLKTSLKEKELLLREIHHRVKNSLQIISSLLSLQADEIDDEEIIERYNESENRIHTIALIHENLHKSTDISHIDFRNYVEVLLEDIMNSYHVNTNKIKTVLDLDSYELGIETAIPTGLIINELVSNAIKHAFKKDESGVIKIILNKEDEFYVLTIQDDGIGLSGDLYIENVKSLGLMLVNALVNQLDGKIEVKIDNGTKFIITFKELHYNERF